VLAEHQQPLRTFSAIFPGLPEGDLLKIDERRYVQAVLEAGRFDASYFQGDRASPLLDWSQVFWHLDEPCLAPNLYLHWGLYGAASSKGVRVFLDGLDGDTTVSHGLAHLSDLARSLRWIGFLKEARALSFRNPSAYPFRTLVWRLGVKPVAPSWLVQARRRLRRQKGTDGQSRSGATHNVVTSRFAAAREPHSSGAPRQASAREEHWKALSSPLIPYTLEIADKASAAFGVEARYPFFDRRLVEFCLSLPAGQKLSGGWTRAVMRRAMDGVLPAPVQWRTDKADLLPGFKRGLFERDHSTIQQVIAERLDQLHDYLDVDRVRTIYERWRVRPMQGQRDALTLYVVATLALWFDTCGLSGPSRPASV
jgi:asparagine synthase (glutamine-hydrolysing)